MIICCLVRAIALLKEQQQKAWRNAGMMISRGKLSNMERNLLQGNSVHHRCHIKTPGFEPKAAQ
jgi:hypothetical protein